MSPLKELIEVRDARIIEMIKQGRAITAIAAAEGYDADYTRKMVKTLALKHGLSVKCETKRNQHANAVPTGLSDRTASFRKRAAARFYFWVTREKKHHLAVTGETGIKQSVQKVLRDKPHGPYDWTLSNLDRWSHTLGVSFEELILDLTFDPETAARMKKCLKND